MASSEPESPETSSLFAFTPFLFGFTNNRRDDPNQESRNPANRESERFFLVNPFTQSMVVIEGSSALESLLRDLGSKDGPPPASKASIEALPAVQLLEEGECVICLDEWEIGATAKELPCKHKFHPNCIEKWLGIHGSCPICRHKMPVDDGDGKKNDVVGRGRRLREIWVGFSFNNDIRSDDSNPLPSSASDHEAED